MRNKITTEELIKQRFPENKAQEIIDQAEKDVAEIKWGGKRKGAGRKPKGNVLKFTKRLSDKEVEFINYARSHNINYDDLMQG